MYGGTPTFWQRGLWDSCFQNPSESSAKVSLIIGISNGNFIHKDDVKFPNFSQNVANFPIPWAPAPFPKRGVRALLRIRKYFRLCPLEV